MLQYITDNKSSRSVEEQIKQVLDAGCMWIEINTDGIADDRIKEIVNNIMSICIEKEAFLILRDRVELAKEINVGGVILSQGTEFPSHARAHLGAAAVVGVEISTTDQIAALTGLDVDFVMFYPYKSNDESKAKSLGIDAIKKLCEYMESTGSELPRVAAGCVSSDDIKTLMKAGCNGVAMSESLANASDIKAATQKALSILKTFEIS